MVSPMRFCGLETPSANWQIGFYPKIPTMQTATIHLPELMSDVSQPSKTCLD